LKNHPVGVAKRIVRLLGWGGLLLLVLVGPASAMRFTLPKLAPEDAAQIKRLAVVSVLGDKLRIAKAGVIVFQNKSFDVPVPDWGLDAHIRSYMQERIVASGRINGNVESLVVPKSDKTAILDLARQQGFDAVIGAMPERGPPPQGQFVGYSPTVLFWGGMGPYACDGMAIYIWRVSDGKEIGLSQPIQCDFSRPLDRVTWHSSWGEFTEAEKQKCVESVKNFVEEQIVLAFADQKLQPRQ
jgi:hypothetical protein